MGAVPGSIGNEENVSQSSVQRDNSQMTVQGLKEPMLPNAECPKGHNLQMAITRIGHLWVCDVCDRDSRTLGDFLRYNCDECNWDLCARCRLSQPKPDRLKVKCRDGHAVEFTAKTARW